MKRYALLLLLLCVQIHTIEAQRLEKHLYDGLSYSDGVCLKTIKVTYLAFGRDPLNECNDSIALVIRNVTQNIPYTSISFLYKGQKYYISLHKTCKVPNISEGRKIILQIQFYKDIKQPYQNKHPYAIITKIKKWRHLSFSLTFFSFSE